MPAGCMLDASDHHSTPTLALRAVKHTHYQVRGMFNPDHTLDKTILYILGVCRITLYYERVPRRCSVAPDNSLVLRSLLSEKMSRL